jgi:hypothetical protein
MTVLILVTSTQDSHFKSDAEYEGWRKTMDKTNSGGQCIWPIQDAPEEPLVCVEHLADATVRYDGKLYYIMGHMDCPKGHFEEGDEMDNAGQTCIVDDDTGRSECSGAPLTTGKKLKYCKGGPSNADRYGLVKLHGIERLNTPANPYGVTIEDIVIRFVSFHLPRLRPTRILTDSK